jgi:hypothetical protein
VGQEDGVRQRDEAVQEVKNCVEFARLALA